jgi:5-formyltetrahydrofolate cyclo-ligase
MANGRGDLFRAKARLRREVAEVLARLSVQRRREASLALAERVVRLPFVRGARTILAFLSLPTEIETWPIIRWAWSQGKRVAVPRVEPPLADARGAVELRDIVPVVLERSEVEAPSLHPAVRPGPMGILEVPDVAPVPPAELDAVLAPCQAVDRCGRRLGKGGGFYDRFLGRADLAATVAVIAFHEQLVEAVPVAEWDRPVETIVTDAETIRVPKGT